MISLHEEILFDMRSLSLDPFDKSGPKRTLPRLPKNIRYEGTDSLKATFGRGKGLPIQALLEHAKSPNPAAGPTEAARFATLFERLLNGATNSLMGRFSIYEEYGARYAEMLQIFTLASRTIPTWGAYEHAIEVLVNTLLPSSAFEKENKKGLTCEDLLIKVDIRNSHSSLTSARY